MARAQADQRPTALHQAELAISYVLRYGVILCASVIGAGLALRFLRPSPEKLSSAELIRGLLAGRMLPGGQAFHSAAQLLGQLGALDPDAWISAGLLLLILLPVIRVAMTVVLFVLERDAIYFTITLFVLCVLVFGMTLGKAL